MPQRPATRSRPAQLRLQGTSVVTPESYALIATQGDGDERALEAALLSSARTVLVIASKRKAERLRSVMALRGFPESRIAAINAACRS